jgi:hypothetical protein
LFLQGDIPNAMMYQNFGRGFIVHNHDYVEIKEKVLTGYQLKAGDKEIGSTAVEIGQLLKVSLFPGSTASHGYYSEKEGGRPFHLERYLAMTGKLNMLAVLKI